MRHVLNRLNNRVQIMVILSGIIAFAVLALAFGVLFKPQSEYVLLQDVLDPVSENRYSVSWVSPSAPVIGRFGLDDQNTYEQVLQDYLSGKLANVDRGRIEPNAQLAAQSAPGSKRSIRLRSRVMPVLLLKNKSLAVFQVETDTLVLGIDPADGRLVRTQIETRFETIRIASTRLGLSVRHVEATRTAQAMSFDAGVGFSAKLGGFNYYPASAPWDVFWREFPVAEIRSDFQRMNELGANSVRIFLNRTAFESIETRAVSLERLMQLLDIAKENDLRVIVTCFDFGRGYNLKGLAEDWTHLDGILAVAARHDAVALIDLKNEPDLDFDLWGQARVEAWLATLSTLAKASYPEGQVTIGWSNAEDAQRLTDYVDVVSFHDYAPAKTLEARIATLKQAATGKAVMLTEIGHSRWGVNPFRQSQAEAYANQLSQVSALDGVFVWTLNDFDHVPNTVAGWRPWRKAMQAKYGLDDKSAALVSAFFEWFATRRDRQPNPNTSNSIN